MATMPASGVISSRDLDTVFGSDASFSSADYYRGGAFVPATETVPTFGWVYGTWSAWTYNGDEFGPTEPYTHISSPSASSEHTLYWGGSLIETRASLPAQWIIGGYEYQRGAEQAQLGGILYYEVRRRTASFQQTGTTEENINTGVPTSGVLSSSNFYGAENP